MIDGWPLLFGWPAVIFAVTLSSIGIFRRKPAFLYVASILIVPVSAYLATTPRFAFVTLLAPLSLLLAGLAIRHNKIAISIVMTLPTALFYGWLALAVLQQ